MRVIVRAGTAFYQRLRSPAAIYLVANALARGGLVVLIPAYSRSLTPEQYGDFTLVQSLLALAPVLCGGLALAASRFYFDCADQELSRRRVGAVAIGGFAIGSIVAAATESLLLVFATRLGLVGASWTSRWFLTCLVIALLGSSVSGVPSQYYRDSQRPFEAAAFQLLEFVLVAAGGILFVTVSRRGLRGALEALAVAYAVLAFVSFGFSKLVLLGRFEWPVIREALRFSLPFIPHLIASWVQAVADRWAMKLLGSAADLGPYGLASQLSMASAMVVMAWNMERAARTGELYREGGLPKIERSMPRIRLAYMAVWAVPSIITILAIPLLRAVVGKDFASSLTYLPALVGLGLVDAMWHPHQHVVYYAGKSRLISVVTVVGAIASIGLSFALIPVLGVWGAILGRAAGCVAKTGGIYLSARWCFVAARTVTR